LSVLVLGSPSDGLPQDAFPVPTIQASVPATETPEALDQGEIVDASGAPGSRTLTVPRVVHLASCFRPLRFKIRSAKLLQIPCPWTYEQYER
jgi:hypothetical protein